MDKFTVIIILTAIGFFALAAVLLVPIWRFLDSEEKRAEKWNRDTAGAHHALEDVEVDHASEVHSHERGQDL